MLFILTVQCTCALIKKPEHGRHQTTRRHWFLLAYVFTTFALATVGLAGNAKYSQTIWIDQPDAPGGPDALIVHELDFWINRIVVASYLLMGAIMDILLLYRCFIIWNWQVIVVAFMSLLFLAGIAMGVLIMIQSFKNAVFTDIIFQLAYLSISVSTNIIYTLLVAGRLLVVRRQMTKALGTEHSKIYTSVASMVVESAALYSIVGVIYIVTFIMHSNVENLVFLSINHVQGIAQLLIILRVVKGQAYTQDATRPEPLAFAPAPPTETQVTARDSFSMSYIASEDNGKDFSQTFSMPSTSSQVEHA